jgi:hypothetical protein
MKILPVGAELFREDGRKNMAKLIVAFRNFAKAPQNCQIIVVLAVITFTLTIPPNSRHTACNFIVTPAQYTVLTKDFPLQSTKIISNCLLPPDANVLRN